MVEKKSSMEGLAGVSMVGITNQKAFEVDCQANEGKGELRLRMSADKDFNYIQGFRFDHNPVRYMLKLVAGDRIGAAPATAVLEPLSIERQMADAEIANLLYLGCSCLASVPEKSVDSMMQMLDKCGTSSSLSTVELFHSELQHMYLKQTSVALKAVDILASHLTGQQLMLRFYQAGWAANSESPPKFEWLNFESLLDPQAFLSSAFGRITMNGFYNLLFVFLLSWILMQGEISDWNPFTDSLLLAFLIGQVVEEGKEFWTSPRYFAKFWNIVDMNVIISLTAYFCFMSYEPVSRVALSVSVLFQIIRLLGALRNTECLDLGMLVRTTVAMLGSIMSFMLMYLFIIFAFSAAFYFLFSLEAADAIQGEAGDSGRLLAHKGGGGGGSHAPLNPQSTKPGPNPIFAQWWALCLWLFNASLGDFHFEDFQHSEFRLAGVAMLLLFLMVCTVTLLNFMIAILSATYEEKQGATREIFILDLGHDALEMPYRPNLSKPPWMPRPVNMLNMIVFTLFSLAKMPLSSDSRWVERLDSWRWELQMLILWSFGNLLMAVAVLIAQLVLLFFAVFFLIGTAPITGLILIANVLNGEMASAFDSYRNDSQINDAQCCKSVWTFVGFLKSLEAHQALCFASPMVMVWAVVIYMCVPFLDRSSFLGSVLTSHEGLDDRFIEDLWGRPVEEKPLFLQVFFHTHWSTYILGLIWTIGSFISPIIRRCFLSSGSSAASPMSEGWKILRTQAEAAYMRNKADNPSSVKAEAVSTENSYQPLTSNRLSELINEAEGPTKDAVESRPLRSQKKKLTVAIEPAENGGGDSAKKKFAISKSKSYAALGVEGLDDDGFLLVNASDLLEELLAPGSTRRFVLQALEIIYGEESLKIYPLHFFALYIDLDDWYWVACSILWSARQKMRELQLIPEDRRRHLSHHQRAVLMSHPLFGNFCFQPEGGDVPSHGVFFEDWAHAIYDGTFHMRHLHTMENMNCLEKYASQVLVQVQKNEEDELLKRQTRRP